MDMPMMGGSPPMGGAPQQLPPAPAAPQQVGMDGGMDPRKMMLAQALMGGQGSGGPAPTTFAGGLASGMNPMMHQMMMQKMMGGMGQAPQQPITPSATMQQPASNPFMLGGPPTS